MKNTDQEDAGDYKRDPISEANHIDLIICATVTPDMLEYYSKMEERLTSGLSNIKRSRDTGYGMESM